MLVKLPPKKDVANWYWVAECDVCGKIDQVEIFANPLAAFQDAVIRGWRLIFRAGLHRVDVRRVMAGGTLKCPECLKREEEMVGTVEVETPVSPS